MLTLPAIAGLAATPSAPGERLTFEQHVRPILKTHCFHCHGEAGTAESGLDVRLARLIVQGGDSGPAIEKGDHSASLLYQRVSAGEMPPEEGKKLSPGEVATIARWIDQGADTRRPEPEQIAELEEITNEERSFWSFQPIARPQPPPAAASFQARTAIDAFIAEKLAAAGLKFSPEADKRSLIRRATFDLWGLPPTPEEVDAFLADKSPDAYERLIDRLLASPRYGERWGRHWLDVAGYADSDGYGEVDVPRKYAYKYRDYVIRSFNADKPLDEFLREQLAGDELMPPAKGDLTQRQIELLTATGFLRMGPDGTGDPAVDQAVARNDVLAETIKIVSTSILGLSVGCAQCHNHRYDPITQADYYRMRAIFEPAYDPANWRSPQARLVNCSTAETRRQIAAIGKELEQLEAERKAESDERIKLVFAEELAKLPKEVQEEFRKAWETPAGKRTAEQTALLKKYPSANIDPNRLAQYRRAESLALIKKFDDRRNEIRAKLPSEEFIHALTEVPGKVPTTHLFFRGDINEPREAVEPAELSVLADGKFKIPVDDPAVPTTGRRLSYARHLTDGKHPLVPRVLVNRVWMLHFGRGIVATPADFGVLGERPSHPELLDWLATDLMAGGWRLKRLHRLIMISTVYRQQSTRDAQAEAIDPENRLLWRMNVRRLEAEVVRDAVLAVSGRLNEKMFGPPVPVTPDEVGQVVVGVDTRDSAGRPTGKSVSIGDEAYRRSIYVQVRRSLPLSMLETFDAPSMSPNCEVRAVSTVAPQSLLLMNNDFVIEQSREFAAEILDKAGTAADDRVQLAWRLAFGRSPAPDELAGAKSFLAAQRKALTQSGAIKPASAKSPEGAEKPDADTPERLALVNLCQALLCSNEFLYID